MGWVEKEHASHLDDIPVQGLFYLIGDVVAQQTGRDWKADHKLRMMAFPSGKQCELWPSHIQELGGIVHIVGELDLPFRHTRDQAAIWVDLMAEEGNYCSQLVGSNSLMVFDPGTDKSFLIVYDPEKGQMKDVIAITPELNLGDFLD